jgi:hypothetical protein
VTFVRVTFVLAETRDVRARRETVTFVLAEIS